MVGLGLLKDMPGNSGAFTDIIPVDYLARQVLVSLAYTALNARQTPGLLMITHSTTSSANPVTYGSFFTNLVEY